MAHTAVRRTESSNAFRLFGRDKANIDLLRPDALLPFGRIGTLNVMIVIVAASLSSFQSLDAELRWGNYGSGIAAAVPMALILALLPMVGVRSRVRRAKQEMLRELDVAISTAERGLEPASLRYLGDLIAQRETVKQTREWPLDTTAFSRIAIYGIIPPIAWVGGAIVEALVQTAITGHPQ